MWVLRDCKVDFASWLFIQLDVKAQVNIRMAQPSGSKFVAGNGDFMFKLISFSGTMTQNSNYLEGLKRKHNRYLGPYVIYGLE